MQASPLEWRLVARAVRESAVNGSNVAYNDSSGSSLNTLVFPHSHSKGVANSPLRPGNKLLINLYVPGFVQTLMIGGRRMGQLRPGKRGGGGMGGGRMKCGQGF